MSSTAQSHPLLLFLLDVSSLSSPLCASVIFGYFVSEENLINFFNVVYLFVALVFKPMEFARIVSWCIFFFKCSQLYMVHYNWKRANIISWTTEFTESNNTCLKFETPRIYLLDVPRFELTKNKDSNLKEVGFTKRAECIFLRFALFHFLLRCKLGLFIDNFFQDYDNTKSFAFR